MVDAGLSPKVDLSVSTTANPVKLHMTLINSRKKSQVCCVQKAFLLIDDCMTHGMLCFLRKVLFLYIAIYSRFNDFLLQKFGTKREAFDASTLLELYKNYYFGTVVLNRISICKLNSGENDNYYDELASINLG